MRYSALFALLVTGVIGLPSCGGGRPDDPPPPPPDADADGDGISDAEEGRDEGRDSDGDGTPDYLDLDSDGNGIPDALEGTRDLDADGEGDWFDDDDDGDSIPDRDEIGPDPSAPWDTDGDGERDFQDPDSDGDLISDLHEHTNDEDGDGVPDRLETDSDGDGILDRDEAGDGDVATPPVDTDGDLIPDYRDEDSDGDGLSDAEEWAHRDDRGTDPFSADTDGDGVSDMIEWAAGTGIDDPADNPMSRGDFVFVVPYEEDPTPPEDTLDFETNIRYADLYFLMDRTGSMRDEILSVRSRLTEIIERLTCAAGETEGCVEDLWLGFGYFTDPGLVPYWNVRNLSDDYADVQAAIPETILGGVNECQRKAVYCVAHGPGGECPDTAGTDDVYPCPAGRVGYPCFRPDAARLLALATDETMDADVTTFIAAGWELSHAGITFVGINTEPGGDAAVDDHLRQLAVASGQAEGSELVFAGNDDSVVDAVIRAVETAVGAPFDVGAVAVDDEGDDVDATLFIDFLEVNTSGAAPCTSWAMLEDSTGDGHDDRFVGIPPGTPVCWDVHAAMNTVVPPSDTPQMFTATIQVRGVEGDALLDERTVYFLVPPDFYVPPPD